MKKTAIKVVASSVALVLLVLALLSGCAGPAQPEEGMPETVIFGYLGTGVGYAAVAGVSDLVKRELGVPVALIEAHTAMRVSLMHDGELHIGLAGSPEKYEAYRGIGPAFEEMGPTNLRTMFIVANGGLNFVTLAKRNDINSIADIKGKRVSTMSTSRVTMYLTEQHFKQYGFTLDDVTLVNCASPTEIVPNVVDEVADVAIFPGTRGHPMWSEWDAKTDLKWLPVTEDLVDNILAVCTPGFAKGFREGGAYKGEPQGNWVVGMGEMTCCAAELPETFIYDICKLVWDTKNEEYKAYHPSIAEFLTLESTLDLAAMKATPFHAGAVKYYKEIGAWTEECEAINKAVLDEMGHKK